jgi:hypothetical protein
MFWKWATLWYHEGAFDHTKIGYGAFQLHVCLDSLGGYFEMLVVDNFLFAYVKFFACGVSQVQ